MFGIPSLPWLAAGAGVIALVAFGGGWKTRDAFCDAARLRLELAVAQDTIARYREDGKLKANLQGELDVERDKLDEITKKYEASIAADDCPAGADDVDALSRIMRGGSN